MAILYPGRNIGPLALNVPNSVGFASFAARASNDRIRLNNPDCRGLQMNRDCPKGAIK